MNRFPILLLTLVALLAAADEGVAQSDESQRIGQELSQQQSPQVRLYRAQRLAEAGELRESTTLLRSIVDNVPENRAYSALEQAALRLLASNYSTAANHTQAIKFGQQFLELLPASSTFSRPNDSAKRPVEWALMNDELEMRIVLARAYQELGNWGAVRTHFTTATQKFLGHSPTPSLRRVEIQSQLARLNSELGTKSPLDRKTQFALVRTPSFNAFAEEQRFQAVRLWTQTLLACNLPNRALRTLDRLNLDDEQHRFFNAQELTDLIVLKARCQRLLDNRAASESETVTKRMDPIASQRKTLVRALRRLTTHRRRLDQPTTDGAAAPSNADLCIERARTISREADLWEWLADLQQQEAQLAANRKSASDVGQVSQNPQQDASNIDSLTRAAATYQSLQFESQNLRRLHRELASIDRSVANREALDSIADSFSDAALSGLQRTLTLLCSDDLAASADFNESLADASQQLVELRRRRMLPADPLRLEAELSLAFVNASNDEFGQAINSFSRVIETLKTHPAADAAVRAQASLGLGIALLGAQRPVEAQRALNEAREQLEQVDEGDPDIADIKARVRIGLVHAAVITGDYQSANDTFLEVEDLMESLQANPSSQRGSTIESMSKLFFALLKKTEAQFEEAKIAITDGRRLNEQTWSVSIRQEIAYNLAEAAVLLSEVQGGSISDGNRDSAIAAAQGLLDNVRNETEHLPPGSLFDQHVAILSAMASSLSGDYDKAEQSLLSLADRSEMTPNVKARAFLHLARLETLKISPPRLSQATPEQLISQKRLLGRSLQIAHALTEQASQVLEQADERAYPSLRFRAYSESARLIRSLVLLQRQTGDTNFLDDGPESSRYPVQRATYAESLPELDLSQANDLIIQRLEKAVRIAEYPATSTTQKGLNRSQFFTRFAPAYDMLVDQLVQKAQLTTQSPESLVAVRGEKTYAQLLRAIEVSDLARNRTFREQIRSWQTSREKTNPDFQQSFVRLAGPNDAVLFYHLGGIRWNDATSRHRKASDGQGHLFVILSGGDQIHYFPLQDKRSEDGDSLSRAAANEMVNDYVSFLAHPPEPAPSGRGSVFAQYRFEALHCADSVLPHAARRLLTKGASRLVIIPDGALHQLPFEALLIEDEDQEIDFAINTSLPPMVYGPSISVQGAIRRQNLPPQDWQSIVSLGGPEYPTSSDWNKSAAWTSIMRLAGIETFPPLVAAVEESDEVIAALASLGGANSTKRTGSQATEVAFRSVAESANFLHVAAHAVIDHNADNLYGAIALTPGRFAGENAPGLSSDGLIHLNEIYELDFSNCQLAILSACKTLVGSDRPLEAGMSLARAFLERGAYRVVSSQWSISDRASAHLVGSFCKEFTAPEAKGNSTSYAAALHRAKRQLAQSEKYEDPYYWAPLVLVGAH